MSSGTPTTVDTEQEGFRKCESVCSKVQSWLQQAQNQLLGPWDGLSMLGKGCAHIPTFYSLLLNHCKSVLRAKRITRTMSTLKSSWFPNAAELWTEQGSCHLESASCGDTQLWLEAGGHRRKSRSRDERHVLPVLLGCQSVCPGGEEGQEHIQVYWCDRSSWSPLFVTATVAATSFCRRTGVGTDKITGRITNGSQKILSLELRWRLVVPGGTCSSWMCTFHLRTSA